jgi:hypothetical protein
MSITLTWLPNTESNIASYDIQRAPDNSGQPGVFADLTNIIHDLLGPNYNPNTNRFFYIDTTGTLSHWYRFRALDTDGNASGYGTSFQPSESVDPPPFPNQVALDETYEFQTGSNLRCVDTDGNPVADVQIRVYKKVNFDLNEFDKAVGRTTTDTAGAWENPIMVEAGYTYVVHYMKPDVYSPAHQEVVIP